MKYSILILIFFTLFSCKKNEDQSGPNVSLQIINSLTQMTSVLESGVSLIFFHASWCNICQSQRPSVSEVAVDPVFSSVFFGEVEYEDYPDIIDSHNVLGFPTIIIYDDGVEVERFEGGGHSASTIRAAIQNLL